MSDAAPVRIPLDLYSPEQLSAVIIELRAHCAAVRDAAVRAKVSSDTGVAPVLHTSALLLAVLREASVAPTDQPALEKLLRQLEVHRRGADTLSRCAMR